MITGAYISATGSPIQVAPYIIRRGRQIDFFANPGNAATIYLGSSNVQADGTNAWISLASGKSWTSNGRYGVEIDVGDQLYMIGTSDDKLHISVSY